MRGHLLDHGGWKGEKGIDKHRTTKLGNVSTSRLGCKLHHFVALLF